MATRATQHNPAKPRTKNTDAYSTIVHSSARWQRLRAQKRKEYPLCERCIEHGRTVPATSVHHLKPIETHPELAFTFTNLLSTCSACHAILEKHARQQTGL